MTLKRIQAHTSCSRIDLTLHGNEIEIVCILVFVIYKCLYIAWKVCICVRVCVCARIPLHCDRYLRALVYVCLYMFMQIDSCCLLSFVLCCCFLSVTHFTKLVPHHFSSPFSPSLCLPLLLFCSFTLVIFHKLVHHITFVSFVSLWAGLNASLSLLQQLSNWICVFILFLTLSSRPFFFVAVFGILTGFLHNNCNWLNSLHRRTQSQKAAKCNTLNMSGPVSK